ncbi:hypothetical protein [Burkholderia gladioli]|uniref:hypothetical protein n=1 Tax=Burkholderia gladioli TaxID=28095 RepID=UPI00163E2B20|nr:hypothetical protein [Burkholderia gladioli]
MTVKTLLTVSLVQQDEQLVLQYDTGDPNRAITPADVEQLINALAALRETMTPPVQENLQLGEPARAVFDPRWFSQANLLTQGTDLFLRHPGLGWIGYALSNESLHSLSALLQRQIDAIQAPPGMAN